MTKRFRSGLRTLPCLMLRFGGRRQRVSSYTVMSNRDTCNKCGAAMIWLSDRDGGRRVPLDAEPWETHGSIMLNDDGRTFQVLDPEIVAQAHERKFRLYTSHFETCPARERVSRYEEYFWT